MYDFGNAAGRKGNKTDLIGEGLARDCEIDVANKGSLLRESKDEAGQTLRLFA